MNETIVKPEAAPWEPLKLADRCDGCKNAQAFVRFTRDSSELLLCGHHGSKSETTLFEQGWSIQEDNRLSINSKPSPFANAV